jgi:sugar phosphate isomerase/epimerase
MKLGMLTACLPQLALAEIAAWAAGAGYDALEVAVWPSTGGRDFEAAHLDVANFGPRRAEQTRQLFDRHGLTLSALAYYENNLHPDPARRAGIRAHLTHAIDAAALRVPYVGTFVGRDWTRPVAANLAEAEPIFREIVDYAGERDVKIIVENCVMEGWHPDGYPGNLAPGPARCRTAGGATGYPVAAKSTGAPSSTPSTRTASPAPCRWSTKTRSGAATKPGSSRTWRSRIARCGR